MTATPSTDVRAPAPDLNGKDGRAGGTRTPNLMIWNHSLYHWSYCPARPRRVASRCHSGKRVIPAPLRRISAMWAIQPVQPVIQRPIEPADSPRSYHPRLPCRPVAAGTTTMTKRDPSGLVEEQAVESRGAPASPVAKASRRPRSSRTTWIGTPSES